MEGARKKSQLWVYAYGARHLETTCFVQVFLRFKKNLKNNLSGKNVPFNERNNPSRPIVDWVKIEREKYFSLVQIGTLRNIWLQVIVWWGWMMLSWFCKLHSSRMGCRCLLIGLGHWENKRVAQKLHFPLLQPQKCKIVLASFGEHYLI